jgi:succinate dehydrogenase / fumarate reductase, cytochrome b subunit
LATPSQSPSNTDTVPRAEGLAPKRGLWLREVWASSIGKKVIVAITGLILGLYVVLHALGNLKMFQGTGSGSPAIDHYADWLRTVGGPAIPREGALWTVRAVLVLALILHVVAVVQLAARNRAAKPLGHRNTPKLERSLASSTMLVSGVLLLAFIVFHVLHFTTRTIQTTPVHEGTVYANMYAAFQQWYFVAIYVVAMALLGMHLWHAIWSTAQTMGVDKPNRNPTFRRASMTIAVAVALGFASAPVAIWAGALPEPEAAKHVAASGVDR